MLSVVHVITRLELGGAQQNTLSTCAGLAERGHRVHLLYGPGGILDAQLDRMPAVRAVPVPALGRSIDPRRDGLVLNQLARHLRRIRDDRPSEPVLVHTHSSKAGILGRFAAASVGLRHILHGIHGFGFHAGQPSWVRESFVAAERAAALRTRAFVAVCRANVAEAQARGIIGRHHRVEVIRSGMELEPFFEAGRDRAGARRRVEAPDGPLLVCIANFKPQKDPVTLMQAMRRVLDERPEVHLWFAGDGPLRTTVEALIRDLRMEHRVRLLGWRQDVPQLMAAADAVVLSSIFEGLPRTAVQAVATGRPFVGTRVDGTPEIIRCGREGFLVEPRDPETLAIAMLRALQLPPGNPASSQRLQDWSLETLVTEQEALYQDLISSHDGAR